LKYQLIERQTLTGEVKAVHDGDSFKIKFETGEVSWIRIYGCDAPEVTSNHVSSTQPFGRESGNIMRAMIKGKRVKVDTLFKDKYGRMICNVFLLTDTEIDLTDHLISNGLAWWLDESNMTPETRIKLKSQHELAKAGKVGLWGQTGRKLRPSTWRGRNRNPVGFKFDEDLF